MDRRKSIKTLVIGGFSIGAIAEACKQQENSPLAPSASDKEVIASGINRMKEEIAHEKMINAEPAFFTADEMATITILGDIIIPKDEVSGSASDAQVPAFIEFIVKDKPEHQTPLRGGLRWLDVQCLNRFGNAFKDCEHARQMEMVDEIAWPRKAKPDMLQGVAFFNLMRNLVATGFYTSEMGVKDIGYIGNAPFQWNGVPADVLKQYNLAYTEKELKECISFS
ncbi:MAG TPA: gluconate 2-dehydrogenase subunit 3 family protein [Puia sp.]|nr:gluconate 2-dehydrogenase subunit 3 family protein [Puia sp.]